MNKCYEHIKLNPKAVEHAGSCKRATVVANIAQIERLFGDRHTEGDMDKVSAVWFFETPRGRVSIRDWWAAPTDHQTIASTNSKAALWMVGYVRKLGLVASMGTRHGT